MDAEGEVMSTQVKAIYENGVFRPLQRVDLPELQEVTVTIDGNSEAIDQLLFALPPDRWQRFCDALDEPPREIPALRKLMKEASSLDGNGASPSRPHSD
jgi:predicted DNA-binding antitoxin AbrB/MazE fold protein